MSDKQTSSNWKQWVAGAVVVAIVVGIAYWILITLWDGDSPEAAELAAYLIAVALGVCPIVISGFRVAAMDKTARAMQQTAAATDKTARAMQQTADSTEKGNVAERFKNAIEHLGHESGSVRLGGVYALHHLAQEEENYRERVFEILCAHIRETTTVESYKQRPSVPGKDCNEPTVEIQSILNLLFISESGKEIYKGNRADLQRAHLQGAILANANLEKALLLSVDLHGATLMCANLKGAAFGYADLHRTFLGDANLESADMEHAQNLESKQLMSVEILYRAKIPVELEKEIETQNPGLFEKPTDET